MSAHETVVSVKTRVLAFLKKTQKATASALGGVTALASASFIPAPYNGYIAGAVVVLTWIATYAVPYVTELVESVPTDLNTVAGIPAAQLIAEHEAELRAPGAPAAPDGPADAVEEPAPTEDTPETAEAIPAAPETRPMAIDELLDALHGAPTGETPAVTSA